MLDIPQQNPLNYGFSGIEQLLLQLLVKNEMKVISVVAVCIDQYT